MSGCCGHDAKFDGVSDDYKRRLWIVIALNATMFAVEMTAGQVAQSQALKADALDFLGDALTYGISLAVIGASIRARTNAALAKGISLLLMGLWVFGSTVYRVFYVGVPEAEIMGHSGNMHIIPATEFINDVLQDIQEGQLVQLWGYLVDARGNDGFRWLTSLSRSDVGGGSCELFYVERIVLE